MNAAVEFSGVSASRGGRPVLHDVTLAVDRGETVALVGRSGSGKTTLLRLVNRMLDPDRGAVIVDGRDTRAWDPVALPAGVIQAPAEMWNGETIMAILVLGIVGTAIAYLLFFEIIRTAGPAYATLVTYLVPPIALAYGAIFLGERFGIYAFVGLALILGGVALATGSFRVASRRGRRGADVQIDSPRG